jgi:hypothetical protein
MPPVAGRTGLTIEQFLLFEALQLAKQSTAIGPSFKGFGQIPPGGTGEGLSGPKQEIEQFFSFFTHGTILQKARSDATINDAVAFSIVALSKVSCSLSSRCVYCQMAWLFRELQTQPGNDR